ncbi:MAG: hypothetical protein JXR71_06055 [Bacteroidales bacterium]|nr:hypothetical protein [Bacteroidales bacterium]
MTVFLYNGTALLSAYLFMEFVAWFSHKYIMHGFLWKWHKDHHINDMKPAQVRHEEGFVWEKNDLFFLIYAVPAMILMITGFAVQEFILVSVAIGITLYGMTYFIVHEIIYHQRLTISFLQKNHSNYMGAVIRAHRAHHHPKNKKDFDSYGLLIFPFKHFKS